MEALYSAYPKAMTVAVIQDSLIPLIFAQKAGQEVRFRLGPSMVDGTLTAPPLSTFVIPASEAGPAHAQDSEHRS